MSTGLTDHDVGPADQINWNTHVVADRAITKGKNVTLTVPRFLTLTATTPPSERAERNNEDEHPLAQ